MGGQIGASLYAQLSQACRGGEGTSFPKPRVTGSKPKGFEYPAQSGSISVLSSLLDRCLDARYGIRFVRAVVLGVK